MPILFAGTGNQTPSAINQNPSTLNNVLANTPAGTQLASLSTIGGTAPYTYHVAGNSNLDISGHFLVVKAGASFAPGTETYTLSVTDANSLSYTAPQNSLVVPAGPASIQFTGTAISVSSVQGDLVGTLSTTGGTSGYTYACSNSKFQIVGNQVQRSGTGTLTQGSPESLNFTSTDAAGLSTDTSTNGQGPYSVSVTASTVPTGINQSVNPVTVVQNQLNGSLLCTLTAIGGTGVSPSFSVTGNTNLTVVNTSGTWYLKTAGTSFVAGVNQTYSLHYTDTGGTYNDPSPRTLVVAAAPTSIQFTGTSVAADIVDGTNVGSLSTTGGFTPYTYTVSNAKFRISGSNVLRNTAGGTLTQGVAESLNFTSTDVNTAATNTATNGQGPFSLSVTAGNVPTAINQNPANVTVLANTAAATVLAALTTTGGTAPYTYQVSGNANLAISGANLVVHSSPSFAPGNYQYTLTVTDNNGNQLSQPFSYTVPAGPSGINHSPDTIAFNATLNTVATTYSSIGGTPPFTFAKSSGFTKFNLDTSTGILTLNSSGVGNLTTGVAETGTISVTDAAGLSIGPLAESISVTDPAAQTIVTTRSFVNDLGAGTALAAGMFTPKFGIAFAKGDINGAGATGAWPQFYGEAGTSARWSKTANSTHTDGSVKHMGVQVIVPDAVPGKATVSAVTKANPGVFSSTGHGLSVGNHVAVSLGNKIVGMTQLNPSLTNSGHYTIAPTSFSANQFTLYYYGTTTPVDTTLFSNFTSGALYGAVTLVVKNNGPSPGTSGRTTADLTSGNNITVELDINVVDGVIRAPVTYTAPVSDFANSLLLMDGSAGSQWQFWNDVKHSGTPEGNVVVSHKCTALNNTSGALGGVLHRGRIRNPYYDAATKAYRGFSGARLKNNGSTFRDLWNNSAGQIGAPITITVRARTATSQGTLNDSTHITLDSGAPGNGTAATWYSTNASTIAIISGTGAGQSGKPCSTYDGSTQTLLLGKNSSGVQQTWSPIPDATSVFAISSKTVDFATDPPFETGTMLIFSTTGTLPTGLSASTPLFLCYDGVTTVNTFCQYSGSNVGAGTGGVVILSSQGSGIHTATPYSYVAPYNGFFTSDTDCIEDFFQGSGSISSDTTLRQQMTMAEDQYFRSSKVLPPYDIENWYSKINTSASAPNYHWNMVPGGEASSSGNRNQGQAGERNPIALHVTEQAQHFLTPTLIAQQYAMVWAFTQGCWPVDLRSSSTRTIPNVIVAAAAQTGMPGNYLSTPPENFEWGSGVSPTPSALAASGTFGYNNVNTGTRTDGAHTYITPQYCWAVFGEMDFLDLSVEIANWCLSEVGASTPNVGNSVSFSGGRNVTVSGTTYHGVIAGGTQLRDSAWGMFATGQMAGFCPDSLAECDYRTYFTYSVHQTYDSLIAWRALLPAFAQTMNIFCTDASNYYYAPWEEGYLNLSVSCTAAMTEYANTIAVSNWVAANFNYIYTQSGAGACPGYYSSIRSAGGSNQSYITSYPQWGGKSVSGLYSYAANVLTIPTQTGWLYTPSNGDTVHFFTSAVTPNGLTPGQTYFLVNVSGRTTQLSLTSGGTPVTMTGSGSFTPSSGSGAKNLVNFTPSNTTNLLSNTSGGASPTSYAAVIVGQNNINIAMGGVGNSGITTDIKTQLFGAGGNFGFATDAKNCFGQVY